MLAIIQLYYLSYQLEAEMLDITLYNFIICWCTEICLLAHQSQKIGDTQHNRPFSRHFMEAMKQKHISNILFIQIDIIITIHNLS